MRVAIMTEYPSPSVQSGPALHTRFLYERLRWRGHRVVLMGPNTDSEVPITAEDVHLYRAVPYPTHPKVKIPMPGSTRQMANAPRVDVIHSQTNTHMVHYAVWMRRMWRIPILNTHTIHIPTHSHFVLSDRMYRSAVARRIVRWQAEKAERGFARLYNLGDTLIVQSRYLVDYWRARGVTVPIEVVGRPVDPSKFSRAPAADPYPPGFRPGKRLLVVCRHDREKRLPHLLDLFDRQIAPRDPDATLTLVGDGHDHVNLLRQAGEAVHRRRIHFAGEVHHGDLVDWYAHGDVFTYTSLSETFGNVVNEALWCGIPVVALDDGMGVAHQVAHGETGVLVAPGRDDTDELFGAACLRLLAEPEQRTAMAVEARARCRAASHPDAVIRRFERLYEEAIAHCRETVPRPLSDRPVWIQRLALRNRLMRWWSWHTLLFAFAKAGGQRRPASAELTAEAAAAMRGTVRASQPPVLPLADGAFGPPPRDMRR